MGPILPFRGKVGTTKEGRSRALSDDDIDDFTDESGVTDPDGEVVPTPPPLAPSLEDVANAVNPDLPEDATRIDPEIGAYFQGLDEQPPPLPAQPPAAEKPADDAFDSEADTHLQAMPIAPEPTPMVLGLSDSAILGEPSQSGLQDPMGDLAEQLDVPTPTPIAGSEDETSVSGARHRLRTSSQSGVKPSPHKDDWSDYSETKGWSAFGESQVSEVRRASEPTGAPAEPELAPEFAKLVSVADEEEFPLRDEVTSIGRGGSNTIVLVDTSVSRNHARLTARGGEYTVSDLDSNNGTFLNDEPVAPTATVRSHDVIRFGNIEFRFVEVGDLPRAVDASQAPILAEATESLGARVRGLPNLAAVVVSCVVLMGATAVAASMLLNRSASGESLALRDQIHQYYLQGVDAVSRGLWDEAKQKFEDVLQIDPSHEHARRYLASLEREREGAGAWQQAQLLKQQGRIGSIRKPLERALDSIHYSDASKLRMSLSEQEHKSFVKALQLANEGKNKSALTILEGLARRDASREEVALLRARLKRAGVGTIAPTREEAPSPKLRIDDPVLKRCQLLLGDGEIEEARRTLRQSQTEQAREFQQLLEKFVRASDAANDAYRTKRTDVAIARFDEALELDRTLTGGESRASKRLRLRLAEMHYVAALSDKSQGRVRDAAEHLIAAKKAKPDYGRAEAQLQELRIEIDGWLRDETSSKKDRRERLEAILLLLSPVDPRYKVASSKLAALKD